MTPSVITKIILFILVFALRSFFAGSEIAFLSVDRLAVRNRARSGHKDAVRLDKLIGDMQRLISIVLIGTNLTGTLTTVLATSITIELALFGNNGVAVTAIIMIFLTLIFGEILPKNYCGRNATTLSLKVTKYIEWCGKLFAPFVYLFNKLNKLVLGKEMEEDSSGLNLTEESIKTMVTIGEEEGDVLEAERDMIYGVFDSSETHLKEIMIPRVDIEAADIDDGFDNVVDIIMDTGFSRIPVYEETIDNIIGFVNAKDVLEVLVEPNKTDINLRELLREPYFAPETRLAGDLLHELKEHGIHAAIVLDEYGGTGGLVTLEDILEEIVGEIQDEYDDDIPEVVLQQNGDVTLDPRVSLEKIEEDLNISFTSEEVETLSGLIYERLGKVPEEQEVIEFEELGVSVIILEVDGNKIERVKIVHNK